MHWIALVLAVIAIALFIAAYLAVPRKWAKIELGLVFVVLAWMAQLIILTGSRITID